MSQHIKSLDFSTIGVPVTSQGLVLQRGGEELMLEKALYRFTVRLTPDFSGSQLVSFLTQVPWGVWRRSIPQAQLELFTVVPEQLETSMSQARADQNVAFVSHVYKFKDNPSTFVYLSDQITIQFATWVDITKINAIAATFNLIQDKPVRGLPNTFVFLVSNLAKENP